MTTSARSALGLRQLIQFLVLVLLLQPDSDDEREYQRAAAAPYRLTGQLVRRATIVVNWRSTCATCAGCLQMNLEKPDRNRRLQQSGTSMTFECRLYRVRSLVPALNYSSASLNASPRS